MKREKLEAGIVTRSACVALLLKKIKKKKLNIVQKSPICNFKEFQELQLQETYIGVLDICLSQ